MKKSFRPQKLQTLKFSGFSFFLMALLTLALLTLVNCTPKNQPRQVHEGKQEWIAPSTPEVDGIDAKSFAALNLKGAYAALKAGDPEQLMSVVLRPFSAYVLNAKFIEVSHYRDSKMSQMVHVFHQALVAGMARGDNSKEFTDLKKRYYQTVFAGCSANLRGPNCINAGYLSEDSWFTRAVTYLAKDLDAGIDAELKASSSPAQCIALNGKCRQLVEERYRRLAMANIKKNRNYDPIFAFAYLKYARLFSVLIDYDRRQGTRELGYITEEHGQIFEVLIAKYTPTGGCTPEFKAFVDNFNPWIYSQKRADTFQHGTKVMFDFGAQCSLYQDASRTKVSPSVTAAIAESQKETDSIGLSFQQMIQFVQKRFGNKLFDKMGMGQEIAQIQDPSSSFYNEYFMVVDGLFRGHFGTDEAEMVLRNTSAARTRELLPKTITTYLKVYLIYMVVETNDHMHGIYTSGKASDEIFPDAVSNSRVLTTRWVNIQKQITLLLNLMESYFKGQSVSTPVYLDAQLLIKAVNRNIHYISVFPSMIVMNFFLADMKGVIKIPTWWGVLEIDADTILDKFFDGGVTDTWFRFGETAEPLDRQMLLYGWDYMLATDALAGIDRSRFFDLIFSKYVDSDAFQARKLIDTFEQDVYGNSGYGPLDALCNYELGTSKNAPSLKIDFRMLSRYTYGGLGENGGNAILMKLVSEPASLTSVLRGNFEYRITYLKAMIELVERDLLRDGEIKKMGEPHKDTERGYQVLAEYEELKARLAKIFVKNQKRYLDCSLKIHEVERRRTNRLYDEERIHLGKVFDQIKVLATIKDPAARKAAADTINANYFRKAENGYRYDEVHGLAYRMSKFDLLARMQRRVEDDIFQNPTEEEIRLYGREDYYRPRPTSVYRPDALARDPMVTDETAQMINFSGDSDADRDAFIRDAMVMLNGKTGSFIEWTAQSTKDESLVRYLNSLLEFYLMGPVKDVDGTVYEVKPEALSSAFTKIYASYTLDDLDIRNARDFKTNGRFNRSFFDSNLFEANGNRLPFFYSLITNAKLRGGLLLDYRNTTDPIQGNTAVYDALKFAQTLINLQQFVFEPSRDIKTTLKRIYGDRANAALSRVNALYQHLDQLSDGIRDIGQLDPRLKLPVYLQEGRPVFWYNGGLNLTDAQKRIDQRSLVDNFTRATGNFFETREKVNNQ